MKLLPPEGQNYIVAGALLSIVLNPLLFACADRLRGAAPGDASQH
jgi:predicted Kef-type K+ transport protein